MRVPTNKNSSSYVDVHIELFGALVVYFLIPYCSLVSHCTLIHNACGLPSTRINIGWIESDITGGTTALSVFPAYTCSFFSSTRYDRTVPPTLHATYSTLGIHPWNHVATLACSNSFCLDPSAQAKYRSSRIHVLSLHKLCKHLLNFPTP